MQMRHNELLKSNHIHLSKMVGVIDLNGFTSMSVIDLYKNLQDQLRMYAEFVLLYYIFNAKKTNNPRRTESQGSDCGGYFDDAHYKLRGKERARFKKMLEDLLSAVPDTLTVDEVAELTGYHRRTVLRYVQRKYIYAINIMGSTTSQSIASLTTSPPIRRLGIHKNRSGMKILLMTIKLCLNMNLTLVFGVVLIMQHTFNEV